MAHFAQLDENNIVTQVIVLSNEATSDHNGVEAEELGVAHCRKKYGLDTRWKQTSYNSKFRGNYAGIGCRYDEELDAFIHPQPFPSWTLDTTIMGWVSPIGPAPTLTEEQIEAGQTHIWNEETISWDLVTME